MKLLRIIALSCCYQLISKLSKYTRLLWRVEDLISFLSNIKKERYLGYVSAIIVTSLAIHKFNAFGGLRFEQYLFFLILPFTLSKTRGFNKTMPLFFMTATCLVIFYFTHIYSIFFLGVCCAILTSLVISNHRPTLLSFGLAIICTPAIKYLLSVFSFPLRLKLTELAGKILLPLVNDLHVSGNCIFIDGIEFTVAPECLGLNMISTTLVFSIFTLSFFATKYKQKPKFTFILTFIFIAFVLVVLANLSRIILTILLKAMPGTALHEAIGILMFMANCCIPLLIIGANSKRFYRITTYKKGLFKEQHFLSLAIAPLLIVGSYDIHKNSFRPDFKSSTICMTGFNKEESKDGVVKLENDSALIYVKPPAFMLGSDHNPFICWKASGYKIKNETEIEIGNNKVYSFELHKANETPLYSCWWYSNGASHTISQLKWRLATLKGDKAYSVVNVTSSSSQETKSCVQKIMSDNIFIQQP